MTWKFSSDCHHLLLVTPVNIPYRVLHFGQCCAVIAHRNNKKYFLWEVGSAFLYNVVYYMSDSDVCYSPVVQNDCRVYSRDSQEPASACQAGSESSSQSKEIRWKFKDCFKTPGVVG